MTERGRRARRSVRTLRVRDSRVLGLRRLALPLEHRRRHRRAGGRHPAVGAGHHAGQRCGTLSEKNTMGDIYVPKCRIDLSFNSSVILDFLLL